MARGFSILLIEMMFIQLFFSIQIWQGICEYVLDQLKWDHIFIVLVWGLAGEYYILIFYGINLVSCLTWYEKQYISLVVASHAHGHDAAWYYFLLGSYFLGIIL